jgi:hypothetical protein
MHLMAQSPSTSPVNVGFLTIFQESSGYLGGYLVANQWGRPLEFRISSAVQPNRVHQILYAGTLESYLCADLIGKALVDRAAVPVQLLVTDRETVLDLRLRQAVPVIWMAPPEHVAAMPETVVRPGGNGRGPLLCHARFTSDVQPAQELLERLDGFLDLTEPFLRVREAVAEARKMGVAGRATPAAA